jgi:hypothetical protein
VQDHSPHPRPLSRTAEKRLGEGRKTLYRGVFWLFIPLATWERGIEGVRAKRAGNEDLAEQLTLKTGTA